MQSPQTAAIGTSSFRALRAVIWILGMCALLTASVAHAQADITLLPTLGLGGEATAASQDGSTVVGFVWQSTDGGFKRRACRWQNGTLELLPATGFFYHDRSRAWGVSPDGNTICGFVGGYRSQDASGEFPVLWQNGTLVLLPEIDYGTSHYSHATCVSADASICYGDGPQTNGLYGLRWLNGAVQQLLRDTISYGDYPVACTPSGSTAVGYAFDTQLHRFRPVRWDQGIYAPLPGVPPTSEGYAYDISADGRTIVGYTRIPGKPSWTAMAWIDGAATLLDNPLGLVDLVATGISDDGTTIVGYGSSTSGPPYAAYAVRWRNGAFSVWLEDFSWVECDGVSGDGKVAVGNIGGSPATWTDCPNTLAGGQCNAPPQATNLPFEGRVVTDPDHPLDFTLQIADNDPSQTVTLELDPADLAALTSVGYLVQITHNTNPATVHVWQETSLDLGWAEREWRLRVNASDSQSTTVNNPIDLFVHRRSFLPPRRLLDGHPSTLTPLAQWDARWGFQRTGATDDTPAPALDLIRDWVSGVRADMATIPLQNAGDPVDAAIVRRWFTQSICNNQPCGFTSDPANWIDHPVLVATALSVVWPGAGGQKAEQVWLNVPLQYVSGPRASVYPHANITTRAGSVVSVELVPTERGSGFEAPSGTTFTVLPAMLGGVAGFFCSVSATTLEPNGVHGDKNDILEIARLVEARRPNNNLRLIGCCLTSCIMAGNAMMTGELPQVAHEWTPGEAHTALRTPALAWMTRPGPTENIKLDRWRGSETSNAVPGPGPRFVNGFCVVWDQIERWFNSQGAPIKLVRVTRSCGPNCTENVPLTEAVVREHLDQRRALVFFNGEHWRMISKYDFGGANGALRVFVSDPGTGAQQWLTLAQAGGTNLKGFATVERTSSAQQFNAQATDFEAYATGAERILVTDSAGRKAGIDPTTGEVFGDATSGIAFDAPLDFPGYAPLTDEEWAQRTAESLRRVTMTGTVPTGTYVIDVDDANTTVNIAWRQAGHPVHTESFTPFPTAWGGRVVLQVTVAGACPADLNGDGVVGAQDIAILLGNWGGTGPADLDGNGVVGSSDIAILLGAWGGC